MNDRELLEFAAKAAGIKIKGYYEDEPSLLIKPGPKLPAARWNPLTDDGDALRLVVKLRLVVHVWDDCFYVSCAKTLPYGNDPPDHGNNWSGCGVGGVCDIYAATRRAIVRAAAEIGKTMP